MTCMTSLLATALVMAANFARPADDDFRANTKAYDKHIRPFLAQHCLECHGIEKPKGDLRLDKLSTDFVDSAGRERWQKVLGKIESGEMPPKSKPRPPEKEIRFLTDWITRKTDAALAARRGQDRVVLRRLNRVEYENTVRDLLGVPVDLKEMLPADTSAYGFDNVGEALHVSSFLMERYLEAADMALNLAIARQVKSQRHVFLGYSSLAKETAMSIHSFLVNKLNLAVLDWHDFRPSGVIMQNIGWWSPWPQPVPTHSVAGVGAVPASCLDGSWESPLRRRDQR
jgi:hypothetical protein